MLHISQYGMAGVMKGWTGMTGSTAHLKGWNGMTGSTAHLCCKSVWDDRCNERMEWDDR